MLKSKNDKPIIGINTNYVESKDKAGRDFYQLFALYASAVHKAGGVPVVIPCLDDDDLLRRYVELIDGALLVGGKDYPPELYGQSPHDKLNPSHPIRSEVDIKLTRILIHETEKPLLGICTGAQLINILLGGGLIQHLDVADAHMGWKTHEIVVEGDSRLRRMLTGDRVIVNTSHHQAIDPTDLGEGLRLVARTEADGVVEAVEGEGKRFLVGLQWHPERMGAEHFLPVFTHFIDDARVKN